MGGANKGAEKISGGAWPPLAPLRTATDAHTAHINVWDVQLKLAIDFSICIQNEQVDMNVTQFVNIWSGNVKALF